MKTVQLSGSVRRNVGKKDAAVLRSAGYVPCVLYGGSGQTHFYAVAYDLEQIINSPDTYVVEVEVEGKKSKAIIQEKQFHPVSDAIMHVDFMEVTEDKPVKTQLPVAYIGTSPGVRAGGKLVTNMRRLKVKGLLANLPERITIDISQLELGKVIRVKEVSTENYQILDAPNNPICIVNVPRGLRGNA